MNTEILATYLTKSGEIAMRLFKVTIGQSVSYRYDGKFGAGCTKDFNAAQAAVASSIAHRRGVVLS